MDGSITTGGTVTVKAIGCAAGINPSAVNQTTYTLVVDTPVISLPAATGQMDFSNTTTGDTLYYTTDGSTPTCAASGTEITYGGAASTYPFTGAYPSTGKTVKVIGCKSGYTDSPVVTQVAVATPTATLDNLIDKGHVRTGFLVGTVTNPDGLIDLDAVHVKLDGADDTATITGTTWKYQLPVNASWTEGTTHTIEVYSQNKAGMTSGSTTVTVTRRNNADVDGDGYPEWAVGAPGGYGSVTLYKGVINDLGTTPMTTITGYPGVTYSFGQSIALADINGDGYGDLIIGAPRDETGGYGSGALYIYTGSSGGITASDYTGRNIMINSTASTNYFGNLVVTGDLNNDGISDIIASNNSSTNWYVYIYTGSASFASIPYDAADQTINIGAAITSLGLADMNNDGEEDLIVTGNNVYAGNGTLLDATAHSVGVVALGQSLDAGDLNGDGKPDLVVNDYITHLGNYIIGDGAFGFSLDHSHDYGTDINNGSGVVIRDMDGDGDNDLAIGWSGDGKVYIYKNSKIEGGSAPYVDLTTPANTISPGAANFGRSLIFDDLNMDGKPDMIVGADNGNVYCYKGDGLGGFTLIGSPSNPDGANSNKFSFSLAY